MLCRRHDISDRLAIGAPFGLPFGFQVSIFQHGSPVARGNIQCRDGCDFLLFNKSVSIGPDSPLKKAIWATQTITLGSNDYVFAFEFAALSYIASGKYRYKYKLEGFDMDCQTK